MTGVRMHPRTRLVRLAYAQLGLDLLRWQEEHDLTDVEMLGALVEEQARVVKRLLRAERHPDDPDAPADEMTDADEAASRTR